MVAGGGAGRRLPGWVRSEGEAGYRAERGERGRGEQDVIEPAGGAGAGGVGDRAAGGGRHRGGYPGAGAGGNGGGQPVGGAGRGGQARQGVQGGGGDAGGVEGAEHGHAGGGADLAQRVHQAGGHPGTGLPGTRQGVSGTLARASSSAAISSSTRARGARRSPWSVPGWQGGGEKVGEQLVDALSLVVVHPVRGVGQALDAVEVGHVVVVGLG